MQRNSEEITTHECADGACHAASPEHDVASTAAFPRVHAESAADLCPQAKSSDDTFHASAAATALCSTNEPEVDPRISGAPAVEQKAQRPSAQMLFSSIGFVQNVTWTRKLFDWFGGGCDRSRRYAAYVFGVGGEGKTRIVRAMADGMNVFECRLNEPFGLQGFSSTTDVLLVDDVNWDTFDHALRASLLCIMGRMPTVIQRKFKTYDTVVNKHVLTIFTSNFKLPDDYSFRRRSYRVWANVKACKDMVSDQDEDSGDDDSFFVNPKWRPAHVHPALK